MTPWTRIGIMEMATLLILTACASPTPATTPESPAQPAPSPATPKRITAAIRAAPASMAQQKTQRPDGPVRGLDAIEELTHAGLTYIKGDGSRAAQLAEDVPTVENGMWTLYPDGRMETTWKIKQAAHWQDGTPLTADDLLFTAGVEQDTDLPIPPYPEYGLIESITAPDPYTVSVAWKHPYIEADGLFSYRAAGLPLPRHLLEQPFNQDKSNFLGLPYWSQGFVGAGAYRITEWVSDSYVLLRANDDYIFGRPKIDEIQVQFIPDNDALIGSILAGTDLTLGKTVSLAIALQVRDQWKDGKMLTASENWTPLNPQFINPDPAIVGDIRFRRALIEGLDRQQLADLVFSGQAQVADSYANPEVPFYKDVIEPGIVRYKYDPQNAIQTIQDLGYTRRSDGYFYDVANQRLSVSIYAPIQNDIHPKAAAAVADYWQNIGVATDQVLIPPQRMLDREYTATFPSFELVERPNSITAAYIGRFRSTATPLPENGFVVTGNSTRYRNPELDSIIDRYTTTIPVRDRMSALGDMVHLQTTNLTQLPLFYGVDPTLVSNRLTNVFARGDVWTQAWNVQEWDLKS